MDDVDATADLAAERTYGHRLRLQLRGPGIRKFDSASALADSTVGRKGCIDWTRKLCMYDPQRGQPRHVGIDWTKSGLSGSENLTTEGQGKTENTQPLPQHCR